jgi:polycomb protein EED
MHRNYVDCVRWFGNLVLSKSLENEIALWQPRRAPWSAEHANPHRRKLLALELQRFPVPRCDVWFMRFGLCLARRLLGVGSTRGQVTVLDLARYPRVRRQVYQLKGCGSTVRGVSFSADGRVMVVATDDATLWRFDERVGDGDGGIGEQDDEAGGDRKSKAKKRKRASGRY